MAATEFSLSHLGLSLHAYHWPATTAANGKAIGIIHGLGEHGGRYTRVAEYFNKHGFEVFAFDHQGHGRSDGAKGAIQSWDSLVSEINTFRSAINGALNTPHELILWGHSMGALLLLEYLVSQSEASTLTGAVVTSPPLKLGSPPPKILTRLASVAASMVPTLTKSNELIAEELSHDPAVVEAYVSDPNNHNRVSMLLGHELLNAPKRLLAQSQSLPVPTLFMHGDADRICDVEGTKQFVKAAIGDVQLRIWPGLYHETHNELMYLDVLAYAKTWIDKF